MVNELAIASEVSMYKVEIAFGRGLRMDLRSKDVVLVVSNEHGKMGELRISRGSVDWWAKTQSGNAHDAEMGAIRTGDGKPRPPAKAQGPAPGESKARGLMG